MLYKKHRSSNNTYICSSICISRSVPIGRITVAPLTICWCNINITCIIGIFCTHTADAYKTSAIIYSYAIISVSKNSSSIKIDVTAVIRFISISLCYTINTNTTIIHIEITLIIVSIIIILTVLCTFRTTHIAYTAHKTLIYCNGIEIAFII